MGLYALLSPFHSCKIFFSWLNNELNKLVKTELSFMKKEYFATNKKNNYKIYDLTGIISSCVILLYRVKKKKTTTTEIRFLEIQ